MTTLKYLVYFIDELWREDIFKHKADNYRQAPVSCSLKWRERKKAAKDVDNIGLRRRA